MEPFQCPRPECEPSQTKQDRISVCSWHRRQSWNDGELFPPRGSLRAPPSLITIVSRFLENQRGCPKVQKGKGIKYGHDDELCSLIKCSSRVIWGWFGIVNNAELLISGTQMSILEKQNKNKKTERQETEWDFTIGPFSFGRFQT